MSHRHKGSESRRPGEVAYSDPSIRLRIVELYRDHGLTKSTILQRMPGLTDKVLTDILKEHKVPIRRRGGTRLAEGSPV